MFPVFPVFSLQFIEKKGFRGNYIHAKWGSLTFNAINPTNIFDDKPHLIGYERRKDVIKIYVDEKLVPFRRTPTTGIAADIPRRPTPTFLGNDWRKGRMHLQGATKSNIVTKKCVLK